MTQRSAVHATFTITRHYPHAPAKVFAAWSKPEIKDRWFHGPKEWGKTPHKIDFRIGGTESVTSDPRNGTLVHYNARYMDIVPDERIITAYDMVIGDKRISVSLAALEFKPENGGTTLTLTEQGAFLDGYDDAGSREKGTRDLLELLAAYLAR